MDQSALLEGLTFGITLLVKTAVILTVAWGSAFLLRRRSAAVRHAIWSTGLFMLILLPLLTLSVPAWRVPLPDFSGSILWDSGPAAVDGSPIPAPESSGDAPVETVPVLDPSAGEPAEVAVHDVGPEGGQVPIGMYAVLAWVAGACLIAAHLAIQTYRIRIVGRDAVRLDGRRPAEVAAILAASLGIRRKIRLLQSARVAMPVTWGLRRPVILLPEESTQWHEDRLRIVLSHELAHVKRLDYLSHLVCEAASALYWPNPLVWVARRQVQAEQEQACDDHVLSMGTRSLEYAAHLLEIARAFQGSRWALGSTVAMAREVSLKARVRAILDRKLNRRPVSPKTNLFIAVTMFVIALPLAALRPGSVDEQPIEQLGARVEDGGASEAIVQKPFEPEDEAASQYLWMEAEDGILSQPMRLEGDFSASGGRFIEVEDDHDSRDRPPMGGRAMYRFETGTPGVFIVWGRVAVDDHDEDSFWIRVDEGRWIRWNDIHEDGRWRWAPVHDSDRRNETVRLALEPGTHTLEVAYREDDVQLDRLLITNDTTFVPDGRGAGEGEFEGAYVWMEAERARLSAPMEVSGDGHASGGRFAWTPEGEREGEGAATFAFAVPVTGTYAVWGRAMGPKGDQNSFFISLDSDREVVWDIPGRHPERTARRWTWDPLGSREEDGVYTDPIVFRLEAGTHTIRVRNRESGTKLDALLVTNDLSFVPRGAGPLLPPAQPFQVWIEAEDAVLSPSMQSGSDSEASGGGYVVVKEDRKSMDSPPPDGRLTYRFEAPQDGRYLIWGRVVAPDDGSDSFWVRVNGGAWVRWNGIRESDHWRWDHVHDADYGEETVQFELSAGTQTLEVAYRESGIRLDKLLITNDPTYRPRGAGPGEP